MGTIYYIVTKCLVENNNNNNNSYIKKQQLFYLMFLYHKTFVNLDALYISILSYKAVVTFKKS